MSQNWGHHRKLRVIVRRADLFTSALFGANTWREAITRQHQRRREASDKEQVELGRRMKTNILIMIAATAMLAGCQNAAPKPVATTGGSGVVTPAAAPVMPESLKHEGWEYFGLDQTGDLIYDYTQLEGRDAEEGSMASILQSATADVATYEIRRAGAMKGLGTEVHEVRADGIYVISMLGAELEEPVLVMPATPEAGFSWTADLTLPQPGSVLKFTNMTTTVEGIETISSELGELEAMKFTASGDVSRTFDSGTEENSSVTQTYWVVKGTGLVRMAMTSTDNSGNSLKVSMELKRVDPGDSDTSEEGAV